MGNTFKILKVKWKNYKDKIKKVNLVSQAKKLILNQCQIIELIKLALDFIFLIN